MLHFLKIWAKSDLNVVSEMRKVTLFKVIVHVWVSNSKMRFVKTFSSFELKTKYAHTTRLMLLWIYGCQQGEFYAMLRALKWLEQQSYLVFFRESQQ